MGWGANPSGWGVVPQLGLRTTGAVSGSWPISASHMLVPGEILKRGFDLKGRIPE